MGLYALEIALPQRGLLWIGSGALAAGSLHLALPGIAASLPWLLFLGVTLLGLVASRLVRQPTLRR